MARRKRIPYDPPGARRTKKRQRAPLRADQIFMTRRMFLAKGTIVAAFAALAAKLGDMQVAKRDTFRAAASDNIRGDREVKPTRGIIKDRAGRELAVNRRSWQVRVVPSQLPEAEDEREHVLNYLISELGLPEALVLDPRDVTDDFKPAVYARTAQLLGKQDLEAWTKYIRVTARYNELVVLEDALTTDLAALCRASLHELPGVRVMNALHYRIANAVDEDQEVVVRADIPRELALKLEANRLYLPGVRLDDSILVRDYPGGEVMSHLLGYVQPVGEAVLEEQKRNEDAGRGAAFYTKDDVIGTAGLEGTMEELLRGHKGSRWVETDARGLELREIAGLGSPAVPGKNLTLTIDRELQEAASRALAEGIRFANEDRLANNPDFEKGQESKGGAVVALDPRTGEVLAMVSLPHYDNQLFADGISDAKYKEYVDAEAGKPLLNRAIMETYPPGSTLKIFHAASALNEGTLKPTDTFTCTGKMLVPFSNNETDGNHYECWLKSGHDALDVYGAIQQSCDIFFYNVGVPKQQIENSPDYLHYYDEDGETSYVSFGEPHNFKGLGIERIKKNLTEQFWFGAPTGIDLPGEEEGAVPDQEWLQKQEWLSEQEVTDGWSAGDTINVSIGQGYSKTTPLQLAVNTAAIANGGTIFKPLLVREAFDDARQNVQTFGPHELRRMKIAARHLEVVTEGMRRVVHEEPGSAHRTPEGKTRWPETNPDGEPEIQIAGKTGTAEFGESDEVTGDYARSHAWFTGFAPLDNPEVAIALVIEGGGGSSTYAVPIADKVMRAFFELTGKRPRGKMLAKTDGAEPKDQESGAEAEDEG